MAQGVVTRAVNTASSMIDSIQSVADNPLIGLIGMVFPQANAVIDVIRRYRDTIDRAQPIITKAVEAGEPVFDKAVEAFPKFATAVSSIMALAPQSITDDIGAALKVENIARMLGGFGRMTPEQEKKWMDDATPGNDPSQENSKFTVG